MKGILLVLSALLLTSCGGGGGGGGGAGESAAANILPVTTTTNGQIVTRTVANGCPAQQLLGAARNDGMHISAVTWLQVIGQNSEVSRVRILANKEVLLRVDLLANRAVPAPQRRLLLIYNPATQACTSYTLNGPSTVPTTTDVTTLNTSYTVTLPAAAIVPGGTYTLLMDDVALGRASAELDQVFRAISPSTAPAVTENILLIPIRYKFQSGSLPSSLSGLLMRMMPLSAVNLVTDPVYTPPSLSTGTGLGALTGALISGTTQDMNVLLSEMDSYCQKRIRIVFPSASFANASVAPKCIGIIPTNINFKPNPNESSQYLGLAYIGGTTMLTETFSNANTGVNSPYANTHWLTDFAITVPHEMGHLYTLGHANCGGATGIDPSLYAGGHYGANAMGYDNVQQYFFSENALYSNGTPQFIDLMGYCRKDWPSDAGYLKTLNYRVGGGSVLANQTRAANGSASSSSTTGASPVITEMATPASTGTGNSTDSTTSSVPSSTPSSTAQWLRISPNNGTWTIDKVPFPPGVMKSSNLSLSALNANGQTESLPLQSAIVSDLSDDTISGPFYTNLGQRTVTSVTAPILSGVTPASWVLSELP